MFTKVGEIRFRDSMSMEQVFQEIYLDSDTSQIRFDLINNTSNVEQYMIFATGLTSPMTLTAPDAQPYEFVFGQYNYSPHTIWEYEITSNSILRYLIDNEYSDTSTLTSFDPPAMHDVVVTLENMTASYGVSVSDGATLLISNIIPNSGYIPPGDVTVTVGGVPRAFGVGYEYTKAFGDTSGSLSIPNITGDVAVTISGVIGQTFLISYNLSPELAGLPAFTPTKNYEGDAVVIKIYSQNDFYKVPEDAVITMDSAPLTKDVDYTYTIVSGIATIEFNSLAGNIDISAMAVLKPITNVVYSTLNGVTYAGPGGVPEGSPLILTMTSDATITFGDDVNIFLDGIQLVGNYVYTKVNPLKATLTIYDDNFPGVTEVIITPNISPVDAGSDFITIQTNISYCNTTFDTLEIYVGGNLFDTLQLNVDLSNREWVLGAFAPGSVISIVYKNPEQYGASIALDIFSSLSGQLYTANQPPASEGEIVNYTIPTYTPSTTKKFLKSLSNKLFVGPNNKLVIK